MGASHQIRIVTNGAVIGGWTGYHVDVSMITPGDAFELRRPFSAQAWNLLRRDSDVTIEIDGTPILRGFVDRREKSSRAGTMTIGGRDRAGRLVDESAPSINYSGLTILQAFQQLASPWFGSVTLSDARNRRLRRGRGKRVAADSEPVVTINIRVPRRGQVHPGEKRSQVMNEIAKRAGLIWWSSCDGKEIFVGKPNYAQAPQYTFAHVPTGLPPRGPPIKDLRITEDDGERYSLMVCGGAGGQGTTDYSPSTVDRRGVVFDNVFNKVDGTGRDFIHPKRMYLPERNFESYGDAQRVAQNEQAKRDYKRHLISVEAPLHGQFLSPGVATIFAPNTIARVIDEEQDPILDDLYLIVSCAYSSNRDQGETTTMHLVPTGTEIVI